MGTIYLLHFEPAYEHAQHYLGWTSDPQKRIERHLAGLGSPLVKAAKEAGCKVVLAEMRSGTRVEERKLKNRGSSKRLCPICRPRYLAQRRAEANPERRQLVRGANGRFASAHPDDL